MSAENKETTALGSSVGADAGQPSEVYTAMYSPTLELVSRDHPDQKLYLEKNQQNTRLGARPC